jgi:uncharacterized membrane protein
MRCDPKGWPALLLLVAGLMCWSLPVGAVPSNPAGNASATLESVPTPAADAPTPLKTLTFLSLSSINDFAFGYLFGSLATGGAMVAANLTTGWGLYYLHESAWIAYDPQGKLPEGTTGLRTATFTIANSTRIFALGLLLTGSPVISGGFVVFNAAGDAAAYVITDKLWNTLGSGPADSVGGISH